MRKLSPMVLALAAAIALPAAQGAPLVSPGSGGVAAFPAGPAAPHVQRGYQALETGDFLAAETAFREALRLEPKAPAAYVGMSELSAQRALASGASNWSENPDIEIWLRRAIATDPEGVMTLRAWARYLALRGRFSDAEAALKKAVAASPHDAGAWLHLFELQLRGLRNGEAAEASARTVIERDRANIDGWMALAAALAAQGRADDAVAAFDQAAQIAPTEPQPLLALARYQASRTQIDAALATLDRLIASMPDAGRAHLDRGDLLLLRNDVSGAMEAFRQAANPSSGVTADAHFRLASLYEAQQRWADAERSYRTVIELSPRFAPAYNNIAFMLAERRQQLDAALQFARRAVELDRRSAAALDTLGWVQRSRGDLDAAAAEIGRAIEIQPRNPAYHYHLGIVRLEQGRRSEAEASLRQVLDLDPAFRHAEDVRLRLKQIGAEP